MGCWLRWATGAPPCRQPGGLHQGSAAAGCCGCGITAGTSGPLAHLLLLPRRIAQAAAFGRCAVRVTAACHLEVHAHRELLSPWLWLPLLWHPVSYAIPILRRCLASPGHLAPRRGTAGSGPGTRCRCLHGRRRTTVSPPAVRGSVPKPCTLRQRARLAAAVAAAAAAAAAVAAWTGANQAGFGRLPGRPAVGEQAQWGCICQAYATCSPAGPVVMQQGLPSCPQSAGFCKAGRCRQSGAQHGTRWPPPRPC